jgi:hypothetical protein
MQTPPDGLRIELSTPKVRQLGKLIQASSSFKKHEIISSGTNLKLDEYKG